MSAFWNKKVFAEHYGILRASAAIELGVPKHILYKRVQNGELVREAAGIYRLHESDLLGNPDLVQISLGVPRAVICPISALYFHELTTQIPQKPLENAATSTRRVYAVLGSYYDLYAHRLVRV